MVVLYLACLLFFVFNTSNGFSAKQYCEPEQHCWPTKKEVDNFKQRLTTKSNDCHGLPTFSSTDDPGRQPK